MNSEYRLYRARVTGVSQPTSNGSVRRVIYITPVNDLGLGDVKKQANPPSPLPTSTLGAGVLSVPSIGQECLVAESATDRTIVCYLQPRGINVYGNQLPEYLGEGDTVFKATGLDPIELRLSREGVARLYGNEFSQLGIDAAEQRFFAKGRTGRIDVNAGYVEYFFDRETQSTGTVQVSTARKDISGFSDMHLRPEQGPPAIYPTTEFTYTYADKGVLYLGDRSNSAAPFHFNTRQSINPLHPQDKTVVTDLRLGFQKNHTRFGESAIFGGSLLEFTGKKNITGQMESVSLKLGKNEQDDLYRVHVNSKINTNRPFGRSIFDPLGEGKGYFFTDDIKEGFGYYERVKDDNSSFYRKNLAFFAPANNLPEFYYNLELNNSDWQVLEIKSPENSFLEEISPVKMRKTHSFGLDEEFKENYAKLSIKSGTNWQLGEDTSVYTTKSGAILQFDKDRIKLGNKTEDLVKIIFDMAELLSTTFSPGYGAPITTASQFASTIMPRIQSLLIQ
jgi:hypothetical protein